MDCKSDVFLSKNEIIRRTGLTKLTLNHFLKCKPYELTESNFEKIKSEIDKQKEIRNRYTKKNICQKLNIDKSTLDRRLKKLNIRGEECLLDGNIYFSADEFDSVKKLLKEEYEEKQDELQKKLNKTHGYKNILNEKIKENEIKLGLKLTSHRQLCKKFNLNRCLITKYFKQLKIKPIYIMHNAFYHDEDIKKLEYFISHRKEFTKKNNLEKYGVEHPFQLQEIKDKANKSRIEKLMKNKSNLYSASELSKIFDKDRTTVTLAIKSLNLNYIMIKNNLCVDEYSFEKLKEYFSTTEMSGTSYEENEVFDFVKSVYKDKIIKNCKRIISPKELDIYIPNKKLAIEFNGLRWHNELGKDKNYHLNKTKLCKEKGIDLIHIFEDDWIYKKDICKSIISSRLGIYKRKIFARKCEFKEITRKDAKKFLNKNHIQGYCRSNKFYALIYENEIVQMISITLKGFHDGNTELTRMATKLNYQVVGGFSKLIKDFCKINNCHKIVSYIDKSLFNGKGYFNVGFKIVKENSPNYYFVVKDKRIHKSNFRKNKLKKMYENGIIKYFDENDTEKNICFKNKIYRIYNCGTTKVIYIRK